MKCLNRVLLVSGIVAMMSSIGCAQQSMLKATENVVEPKACTLAKGATFGTSINLQAFQEDVIISHDGMQFVAFYDGDKNVCIARRSIQPAVGTWETLRLTDAKLRNGTKAAEGGGARVGWDAHNTISMGIAPGDGTIHLAYDHHGNPLRYRTSKVGLANHDTKLPWSAESFEAETDIIGGKKVAAFTYPQFLSKPDGGLVFTYRVGGSGGGDLIQAHYNSTSHTWTAPVAFILGRGEFEDSLNKSPHRNAYTNGPRYDSKGNLHIIWVWREGTQGANHDISYLTSTDNGTTWQTNDGKQAGDLSKGQAIELKTPGLVVYELDRKQSLMNEPDLALDSGNQPHGIIWHRIPGKGSAMPWDRVNSAYFHYFRDASGKWSRTQLPDEVGTRPRIAFDTDDNAYAIFVSASSTDETTKALYPGGALMVSKATKAKGWNDWTTVYTNPAHFIGDPAVDQKRLLADGTLSIVVQKAPVESEEPTPLSVIDLSIKAADK